MINTGVEIVLSSCLLCIGIRFKSLPTVRVFVWLFFFFRFEDHRVHPGYVLNMLLIMQSCLDIDCCCVESG